MCVTQNTPWRVGVCFPQTCNRTADPTAEAALCGTNSYCSDGDRRVVMMLAGLMMVITFMRIMMMTTTLIVIN